MKTGDRWLPFQIHEYITEHQCKYKYTCTIQVVQMALLRLCINRNIT